MSISKFCLLTLLLTVFAYSCQKENFKKESVVNSMISFETFKSSTLQSLPFYMQNYFSFGFAVNLNPKIKVKIESRSRNEILEAAIINLYLQNKDQKFIEYMISQVGYPVWDRVFFDNSDDVISIPFIDEKNKFTKAFLIGESSDDLQNFTFYFVERRFLDLELPIDKNNLNNIKLMLEHDYDLFGEFDQELLEIYNSQSLDLVPSESQTRCGITIEICRCTPMVLKPEVITDTRSNPCPSAHILFCTEVYVPCDEDSGMGNSSSGDSSCVLCGGSSSNTSNGGSGGSSTANPPFVDDIILLQTLCAGAESIHDTDPNSGGNENAAMDEETADLCKKWNEYVESCLKEDFEGVTPMQQPIHFNPGALENPYYIWGQFLNENPVEFLDIISGDQGCLTTSDISEGDNSISEEECVQNYYNNFVNDYELDIPKTMEIAIKKIGCVDNFEEEAWKLILEDFTVFNEPGNPCEEELVLEYPVQAYKIWINSKAAQSMTEERFAGQGMDNHLDCADAFRHAFFNALNAIDVGEDIALLFSDAHECGGTDNDANMDYHNNSEGHKIGINFPNVGPNVIADRVCDYLEGGQLKILTDENDPDSPLINSNSCMCN